MLILYLIASGTWRSARSGPGVEGSNQAIIVRLLARSSSSERISESPSRCSGVDGSNTCTFKITMLEFIYNGAAQGSRRILLGLLLVLHHTCIINMDEDIRWTRALYNFS